VCTDVHDLHFMDCTKILRWASNYVWSQRPVFLEKMLKTTVTKDRAVFSSGIWSRFSDSSGIYIGLVGMKFVFDKKKYNAQRLPWPFQSYGFHAFTNQIDYRFERNRKQTRQLRERTQKTWGRRVYTFDKLERGKHWGTCETWWCRIYDNVVYMSAKQPDLLKKPEKHGDEEFDKMERSRH